MTLRLLSGNLTISILTKKLEETWSLKIKNNLTQDGVPFDVTQIENFRLVIGDYTNNVISDYEINDSKFVNAELNLNLVKQYIEENDIDQIYAILEMSGHEEIVEVLAWNGTIISHVLNQEGTSRVGVGRNSDNLFVGWKYQSEDIIENVYVSDGLLNFKTNDVKERRLALKDKNNNQYFFSYDSNSQNYNFNLNLLNLKERTEFKIYDVESNLPLSIDCDVLFTEYNWENKAVQFDFDNLGWPRITVLSNYALITNIDQNVNDIDLEIIIPFRALDITNFDTEDYTLELGLEENKVPIYINSVDKVVINGDLLSMKSKISFTEKIPYGEHGILLRLLNKNNTVLKKFQIYLGMQRTAFFNNQETSQFSIVEDAIKRNSPIKLRRLDESFSLEEINAYTSNIFNSRLKRQTAEYVTYRENLPIKENTIVYESFFGALSDNPLALFKEIYKQDIEKKYTHIWVVSNLNLRGLLAEYDGDNVIFVKYNSSEYLRWLATAKNIVFNTSTAFPFATREGQNVLQTWHGVPLKTLGRDMSQARGLNRNVIRSVAQATLFTNPNLYTEKKVLDTLDFEGIQTGKRMIVSYPRQQRILTAQNEGFKDYLGKMMPINSNKKIALYAPTWRGANGNYKNVVQEYSDAINLINKYLPDDYQLIFKPHKNAANFFKDNQSIVIVPDWIDVNEVLSVTDLLISDYSSIIFDFYFTGKPVINWMYDKDDYAKNNGFYPEIFTELVWPTNNENKFAWMLNNLDKYPKLNDPFIDVKEHDIQEIINEWMDMPSIEDNQQVKNAKLYLVYASDTRQQKQQLINKINNLNKSEENSVVALLHIGDYTKKDDDFFDAISPDVRNFYRVGQPDISLSEYIAMKKLKYGKKMNDEDYIAIHKFVNREIQREVGNLNVIEVESLGRIKADDWATKALVEFS